MGNKQVELFDRLRHVEERLDAVLSPPQQLESEPLRISAVCARVAVLFGCLILGPAPGISNSGVRCRKFRFVEGAD